MGAVLSGRELAVRAERIDTLGWLDQHEAAPAEVTTSLQLAHRRDGDLVMVRSAIPFSHFNMVFTLGCPAPLGAPAWRAIDEFYPLGSGGHWVLTNDFSEPSNIAAVLGERGYTPVETWDRIVAQGAQPELWGPYAPGAELVTSSNATEWADFVRNCYGMPSAITAWLLALSDRNGWIHAVLRPGGAQDGPIVMARSAFVSDGWAWLGIDAPVPGIMAPCFEDDQRVSAALLQRAAELGAHSFVTDIEVPNQQRRGPGYDQWRQLGFEGAYLRTVFHRDGRDLPG